MSNKKQNTDVCLVEVLNYDLLVEIMRRLTDESNEDALKDWMRAKKT